MILKTLKDELPCNKKVSKELFDFCRNLFTENNFMYSILKLWNF